MSTGRAPLGLVRAGTDVVTQVLFAGGVLSTVLALRVARSHPSVPWRCRVLRWHVWGRRSTEDGGRYAACDLCGAELGAAGLGPMTTPPWPGSR